MKKILVIEDSDLHLSFICQRLSGLKEIKIAKNLREACDLIDSETFDIVICDHCFPTHEGREPTELGDLILLELIQSGFKGVFFHNSMNPQPELYENRSNEIVFYSFLKNHPKLFELVNSLTK